MTWQLTSFACLVGVLVCGGVWYERTRPSAKIVAMVAALAALAVAGRVVLAPIPNVVATTDIVLFTGYAIGGAPGFAVGALAALVSNFWLGQGPWTPWQMGGWGMVGIGGAVLAGASGRQLGRFGLAFWCGFAGLAYGALLDLSVMVTYGGEQSLDRYLALAARGLPFNIAHAAGNVAFALLAGPALVRMLLRFRERIEVRWQPAPPAIGRGLQAGAGMLLIAAGVGCRRDRVLQHHRAACPRAGGRRRGRIPRASSELRRRFRRRTGRGFERRDDGLGFLGSRGCRHQPTRLHRGRTQSGRLPAIQRRRDQDAKRPAADDPRARSRRA